MRITYQNKIELRSRGWTIAPMEFSKSELKYYLNSTILLKQKAASSDYPFRRTYHQHLFHENMAAVELPFNNLISNNGVDELFSRLNLGCAVKDLLGWQDCYLHLARLFTMEKYKYRGNWHRDFSAWDGNLEALQNVQIAIYLKNQDGFRIFKYYYDTILRDNTTDFLDPEKSPSLPLACNSKYYDEIKGLAGTVLFFAPGILHQGNSFTQRLDYHLRFSSTPLVVDNETTVGSSMYDFIAPDFYQNAYNTEDPILNIGRIPKLRNMSLRSKTLNSINYYTGIINIIKAHLLNKKIRLKSSVWHYSIASNTIYQK